MHVVGIVTADAGAALRHLSRHGFVVAGIAGDVFMTTVEPECGLFVVVETPGLPRGGVMAGFAARPQLVLVLVVLLVAADAGDAGVLEGRRKMALFAFDLDMLAEQREAGQ